MIVLFTISVTAFAWKVVVFALELISSTYTFNEDRHILFTMF